MSARADSGYTLIELVVVLSLLGLIAVAIQGGLTFGVAVWSRSDAVIRSGQQIETSRAILFEVISHSLPRLKGDDVTFVGEPTSLELDSVPLQAFEDHGTTHSSFAISGTGNKSRLVLTIRSLTDPGAANKAVLLEGIRDLRFSYLDAADRSGVWLAYWRDRARLPAAVRIASSDSRRWPPLTIRLAISQSATCALDPVSMTCRRT